MKRKILEKKRELINRINKTSAQIKALEKIERVKTKSGNDFKVLSKNFKNVTFDKPSYITEYNKDQKELYVMYDWKKEGAYNGMYTYREYEKLYLLNLKAITNETSADEIEQSIKDLIEQKKKYLKQYEKALSIYDDVMTQFESDINQVFKIIKLVDKENDTGKEFYYIATDIVHNCYF